MLQVEKALQVAGMGLEQVDTFMKVKQRRYGLEVDLPSPSYFFLPISEVDCHLQVKPHLNSKVHFELSEVPLGYS